MSKVLVPIGANVEETGFTLEGRVLCGDDACIGTIGPDRRCKLCGRSYEGDAEVGSGAAPKAVENDAGPVESVAGTSPSETETADAVPTGGDRTCCPDDACVGILGPNGVCGVCGKSAS
jgi:hypothetical protein